MANNAGEYLEATGSTPTIADATDIRGSPGPGATGLSIADEATAEAGTDNTTAMSPLQVHNVIQHLKATAAQLDSGAAQIVFADVLQPVLHALQTAQGGKLTESQLLVKLLELMPTEAQKSALRQLIGALAPEGEWSATVNRGPVTTPTTSGAMQTTDFDIPAGATEMRFTYEGSFRLGDYIGEVNVSRLLALPEIPAGGGLASALAGSVIELTVTGDGTPPSYRLWLGHRGRTVWLGTDETRGDNQDFSLQFQTRQNGVEFFALADRTTPLPAAKQTPGWLQFTQALLDKLNGIQDNAQVNVQSDLRVTNTALDTFVAGKDEYQAGILAAVPRPTPLADLPRADPDNTLLELVEEQSGRKDAQIAFGNFGGSEFWGFDRGSLLPATPDRAAWEAAVLGIRWRTTGLLNLWLNDSANRWRTVLVNGQSFALTEDGMQTVPWGGSTTLRRQVSVQLTPSQRPLFNDDPRATFQINLLDADGDPVVGAPFVREAKIPRAATRYPTARTLPATAEDGAHIELATQYTWQIVGNLRTDSATNGWQEGLPADFTRIFYQSGGALDGRLAVVRSSTGTFEPATLQLGTGDVLQLTHAPDLPGGIGNPFPHYWVSNPLQANPITTALTFVRLLDEAGSSAFGQTVFGAGVVAFFSASTGNWLASDVGASLQEVREEVQAELARRRVRTSQADYNALGSGRPNDVLYLIVG